MDVGVIFFMLGSAVVLTIAAPSSKLLRTLWTFGRVPEVRCTELTLVITTLDRPQIEKT